jgi:tRNA (guanine37-N1)-methyltransferase
MRFDILTLFPGIFDGYLQQSLLKLAIQRGIVDIRLWNIRDYSLDKHQKVDDRPFGGGPGMLMCCQPVFDCVEAVQTAGLDARSHEPGLLVMLSPQGRRLDHVLVTELASLDRLLLLCGRYEGFDERIRVGLKPMEVSVGDFVTNGGEVPAMLLIDAVIRHIPGVLGDETSSKYDSFAESGLLEYPQYTRPRVFRGMEVPDVLLNGDHAEISHWRLEQSVRRTSELRSDLLNQPIRHNLPICDVPQGDDG